MEFGIIVAKGNEHWGVWEALGESLLNLGVRFLKKGVMLFGQGDFSTCGIIWV